MQFKAGKPIISAGGERVPPARKKTLDSME
jgi:hypothetical protein